MSATKTPKPPEGNEAKSREMTFGEAAYLDAIAVIEPLDSGDARLVMKDGSSVPCSRRYRDGLAPSRMG